MASCIKTIQTELFAMKDEGYRDFNSSLIPNIAKESVIGVRTPALRAYSKSLYKNEKDRALDHMSRLPHRYFEENQLHAFLIEQINDYDECIAALEAFLPYVDNWATCDSMNPKVLKKHLPELLIKAREWLFSRHEYTCRYGIGVLMRYFLDEHFAPELLKLVADVRRDEYYIKMMVAWYFATALAKQYNAALPYVENRLLDKWTHNKTIQKAIESYRVANEHKAYLKTLRI